MIYFLSFLQLFFHLITVSSEQCHEERSVIQEFGGIKESSQSGYYFGVISTPNFPHPFHTPYNQTWVIDASHHKNGTQINIYLTQMYLSRGVRFFQHATYKFCGKGVYSGQRQECGSNDEPDTEITSKGKLHDLTHVYTTCPYLEIQVDVAKLYGYHYRTRDRFLFDVYGFNITYEIVSQKLGFRNDSCYPRNCSNLGHCYLADNWRDFFCDCEKDHPGMYCESSPHCDPENNVTFCANGGKCRIVGSNNGYCDCTGTGYGGVRCENRLEQPKVSARTGCSETECPTDDVKQACSPDELKRPCSCHPPPRGQKEIPKDFAKYEVIISVSSNYSRLRNQSTVVYEIQQDLTNWLKSSSRNLTMDNLSVRLYSPRGDNYPPELQIHFHGPSNNTKSVNSTLRKWLAENYSFYKLIPLLREKLVVYTMPRVKFKSIQINKHSRLKLGKPVSLTCIATTGPSDYFAQRDLRFRWFKDDLPVNTSLATSIRHMTIGKTPTNDNETMSILMIDSVSVFDGGKYTCEVTDLEFGDQECGKEEVELALLPQVEIEPMSLTLERQKLDKGVVITCTDGSDSTYDPNNKTMRFEWHDLKTRGPLMRDDVVTEDIVPQGTILRILRAEQTESFQCIGANLEGGTREKTVVVKVLDSKNSPSCNQHWERLAKSDSKLLWKWTAPDSIAMIPCPKGFAGFVQKPCTITSSGKVQWGRSDFSRCISERLRKVNTTLQNAKRGFGDWQAAYSGKLLGQLEKYVNANVVLYPGEGEKIINLLDDIVKYSIDKKVKGLFPVFFRTIVRILKIPNSCVHEKSVLTLSQIVVEMAVRGAMQVVAETNSKEPQTNSSDVLFLQTLPISVDGKYQELSYGFPQQSDLSNPDLAWLKNKLHVNFPLDSTGLTRDVKSPMMCHLIMAAYKNLPSVLVPKDVDATSTRHGYRTSIELVSPVVHISIPDTDGYYFPPDSTIKINFNLPKEHWALIRSQKSYVQPEKRGTYFSCGALDKSSNDSVSVKTGDGRLRWATKACTTHIELNSFIECRCTTLGIFGLLKISHTESEPIPVNTNVPRIVIIGFTFCILSCLLSIVILSLGLKCQFTINSLYALKLLDCFFILSATFILLIGRTELTSPWLVWSTMSCSFLIASLCTQVTKALRVLIMKLDVSGFIFPWLRNVSQLTLLSAVVFSSVLPVWTGTVAKIIIDEHTSNESVFRETSHVFVVFVGTVTLVVLLFLAIYYKAVLKTRGELEGYVEQLKSSSSSTTAAEMVWVLTYRMKTLNRSLCLTLALLVLTLGIILNENIRFSIYIQYFLGVSATMTGTGVFLAYISHCEYPLSITFCGGSSDKPRWLDHERDTQVERNGSQRKLYTNSTEHTRNGSVVGTIGLLPPPPPILRSTRYFGDDCETQSVSTVEEQSMDTFSTEVSFRASATHKLPTMHSRSNRSLRSGSNTVSSSGSSYRSRKNPSVYSNGRTEPVRGTCLLSTGDGDYILPSNHNTAPPIDRGGIPESTAVSITSYKSYVPINDHHDEIQEQISQDLKILLKD